MRAAIQRVTEAVVTINHKAIASISNGLLVLIGISNEDTESDSAYITKKILNLRVFEDDNGVMNKSVQDVAGEVLLVSQFTLYGDARKGNRPSYSNAMSPDRSRFFYESYVEQFKQLFPRTVSGQFGADMQVSLVNDGPVTILLDSTKIL